MDKPISQSPEFEEEWYEDSVDLNLKTFAMTEDEWAELEAEHLQGSSPKPSTLTS